LVAVAPVLAEEITMNQDSLEQLNDDLMTALSIYEDHNDYRPDVLFHLREHLERKYYEIEDVIDCCDRLDFRRYLRELQSSVNVILEACNLSLHQQGWD